MKELLSLTGGYKRHIDYLLKLQSEVYGVQNSLFKNLGHDLVLGGCELTDNLNGTVNIASGIIYSEGEVVRFAGASNVLSNGTKALKKGIAMVTDPKQFQDESVKNTYKETFAIVANKISEASQIVIRTKQLYTLKDFIADIIQSYGQKGETKWVVDLDGNFLENFDSSGLGVTTKWQGWHLMNGNGGTPPMAGRTPIGVGSLVDAYGLEHTYTNNQQDGQPRHKLAISEMPKHSHSFGALNEDNGYDAGGRGWSYHNHNTSESGGDLPHNIMQPYLAGYWVIKMV